MNTADVTTSISLITTSTGLHGYTVQTAQGAHMAAHWREPAAALFAACDVAMRQLGEHGVALVFRDDGSRFARVDIECPPHVDRIRWQSVDAAAAA